eukprot:gnl/Trimastix_PCT/1051.p1 GENE.gnl/Trimastix_PCT/1051~~gnl/Trimastix_PCT/1051.p1  ORF type:complete len:320 (+),score=85.76 gnl/Trimastix_PCT/1051:40-999(+)
MATPAAPTAQVLATVTEQIAKSAAASSGPVVLNGNKIARDVLEECRRDVEDMKQKHNRVPGLGVVLVGERKDSATYVRMKERACQTVGINSLSYRVRSDATQAEMKRLVSDLNANPDIHGILVQLPLPKHMAENEILDTISSQKDVDGFHPFNLGELCIQKRQPNFMACTPKGCLELLKRAGVDPSGKRAVVLGRSQIVGLPAAMGLLRQNATVSICHSRTKKVQDIVRQADIVIACAGQARLVKGDWIKPGAAVIDVGTNFIKDSARKSGLRLVGDVDFDECKQVAGVITPVPGGVGPMTVAMLMRNTVDSAMRFLAK